MACCPTHERQIVVYLLHFHRPIGKVQHYVGSCYRDRLQERIAEHASGNGSALLRALAHRCIPFRVVRLWSVPGRSAEYQLKRSGHFPQKCPLCNPRLTLDLEAQSLGTVEPRPFNPRGTSLDY